MNTKDLELYYFNTASLEEIRFKYFPILRKMFNVEDLLNNKDISEDDSLSKRAKIENIICDYIKSDDDVSKDFFDAYHIDKPNEICELVLSCSGIWEKENGCYFITGYKCKGNRN